MSQHRGNQPRVVGLLSFDVKAANKLFPFRTDASFITKKPKEPLYRDEFRIGVRSAHAQTVVFGWASCHRPKFVKYLRNDCQIVATSPQRIDRIDGHLVLDVFRLNRAKQDVGIKKDLHHS